MKILTLLLIFSGNLLADTCKPTVHNSCRDQYTKHISSGDIRRANRLFRKNPHIKAEVDQAFSELTKNSITKDIMRSLMRIDFFKERKDQCLLYQEDELDCLRSSIKPAIIYGYIQGFFDGTATIIIMSKFSSKSIYTGTLSSYASKIRLLRKSYLSRRDTIQNESPLSQKKYLKKLGKVKKLTPRQYTLLRYNYSQIKHMGKILQTFENRILAVSAGLYFDYDGDGQSDENYVLDEAEKYRMSVKLLKLELAKMSQGGEIFSGKQPDFHDLLVASNELGLVSDKDLTTMVELPFLYEPKKSPWAIAGKITWELGKGIIMAIPGVNLFSIVPIVLVESYVNSREQQNETSDLHIFTF